MAFLAVVEGDAGEWRIGQVVFAARLPPVDW
jgi:hypothetical protein